MLIQNKKHVLYVRRSSTSSTTLANPVPIFVQPVSIKLFACIAGPVIRQTQQQANAFLHIPCACISLEELNAKLVAQVTSSINSLATLVLQLTVNSVQVILFLAI